MSGFLELGQAAAFFFNHRSRGFASEIAAEQFFKSFDLAVDLSQLFRQAFALGSGIHQVRYWLMYSAASALLLSNMMKMTLWEKSWP